MFDFCSGLPARFDGRPEMAAGKKRIHDGYAKMLVRDLRPYHVKEWLNAHKGWKSTRTAVQAVRRMICYQIKDGRLTKNPIRGVQSSPVQTRIAYFTDEVEAALYKHAPPALALAMRHQHSYRGAAEHRAGQRRAAARLHQCRRGNDLAIHRQRVEGWQEAATVYIPPSIKPLVEEAMKAHPTGKLFRDVKGEAWTEKSLKDAFTNVKKKLLRRGVPIDPADRFYTCRHTFAKRMLGGYWSGVPATLEIVAGLMGNTRDVCWKYYGQWSADYVEPLVKAAGY